MAGVKVFTISFARAGALARRAVDARPHRGTSPTRAHMLMHPEGAVGKERERGEEREAPRPMGRGARASPVFFQPRPLSISTQSRRLPVACPPTHTHVTMRRHRCCSPALAAFLTTPSPARDRAAGLACIAAVAAIWAGASFVVQDIEAAGVPAFALTYVANSLFTLYLPLYGGLRTRAWRGWVAGRGVGMVGSPPGSGRR